MKKRLLTFAIFSSGIILFTSCGGDETVDLAVSTPKPETRPEQPQQPQQPQPNQPVKPKPGDIVTTVKPKVEEVESGVIVRGKSGDKVLEVYIPGATLPAETSLKPKVFIDKGKSDPIRLAWDKQSIEIRGYDSNDYDVVLNIGFKSRKKQNIDFKGAYDENQIKLITGNFDEFPFYFETPKLPNSAFVKLNLNFGNRLYAEGESDEIVVGLWDLLYEGIKYTIPVTVDDLADISFNLEDNKCAFDVDQENGIIYFPTRNEYGQQPCEYSSKPCTYTIPKCISFNISPGSDDSQEKDVTTVNVYEGDAKTPSATLVNDKILKENVSGNYELKKYLKPGEVRDFKVEIKARMALSSQKISSKLYRYKLKGDDSVLFIRFCLTGDMEATTCTEGPQNDPYSTIIANTYSYQGDLDVDNDGKADYAIYEDNRRERILLNLESGIYIVPSTGAKLFMWVEPEKSTFNTGRDYAIEIYSSTFFKERKVYSLTDPASFAEVFVLTDTEDPENNRFRLKNCPTSYFINVYAYRVFNNYKSKIIAFPQYFRYKYTPEGILGTAICKNLPPR